MQPHYAHTRVEGCVKEARVVLMYLFVVVHFIQDSADLFVAIAPLLSQSLLVDLMRNMRHIPINFTLRDGSITFTSGVSGSVKM